MEIYYIILNFNIDGNFKHYFLHVYVIQKESYNNIILQESRVLWDMYIYFYKRGRSAAGIEFDLFWQCL